MRLYCSRCTKIQRLGTELSDKVEKYEKHYVVNYVWINANSLPADNSLCSVPLKYLDNAYNNARLYPEARFMIWIDKKMIDPLSDFFVLSHGYLSAPDNVEYRDLRDIEAVNELPLFDENCENQMQDEYPDRTDNIWGRVDLARLLVIQDNLNQHSKYYQLYADFDVQDVKLNCPNMYKALSTDGLYIGTTFSTNMMENGYLCFGKGEGMRYLKHDLIPLTINNIQELNDNGWNALVNSFERNLVGRKLPENELKGPRQEGTGYIVPDVQKYKDWGLN